MVQEKGMPESAAQWEESVRKIEEKYSKERMGEIVFYGASNFAYWDRMEEDFPEYRVQNHAFGGSTDRDLVYYADRILYPYEPSVIVLQTGSNDYIPLPGTDDEKISTCMAYKKEMYSAFHERLPQAEIIVMSGLLLPGRSEYLQMTLQINRALKQLACETEYLYFADADAMTWDGHDFTDSLFRKDGIHLNHEGQLRWGTDFIKPALRSVTDN